VTSKTCLLQNIYILETNETLKLLLSIFTDMCQIYEIHKLN